jgi:stage II sporulation protein E
MIDLYTGETEFIKNGAEPSYIKRKQITETIRAASLPVGVLTGVEAESFAHRLESGDTIVMVSDGLELRESGESWILHTLERFPENISAQELADGIMQHSRDLKGGKADDDMTVLVLRLLKI